jgi:hypothetical protein
MNCSLESLGPRLAQKSLSTVFAASRCQGDNLADRADGFGGACGRGSPYDGHALLAARGFSEVLSAEMC